MIKRDEAIQNFSDYVCKMSYGMTQREAEVKGICLFCKKPKGSFRTEKNKIEYEISCMCQKCQDDFYGSPEM